MPWHLEKIGDEEIELHPDEIVSKARARFAKSGHVYPPAKSRRFETLIADEWERTVGRRWAAFSQTVRVSVWYERQLAKSNPKFWSGRQDNSKPDVDNTLKQIDALNGLAWSDDAQVTVATVEKGVRVPYGSGNTLRIRVQYFKETYERNL